MPLSFLIIKPSSLGDILHTLPSAYLLKKKYPHSHIAWIVKEEYSSFLQEISYLDEVIPFPRGRFSFSRTSLWAGDFWKWSKKFRRRFQVSIDFQGLFRSALMAFLSRSPLRIGFEGAREGSPFFYTHKIPRPSHLHAIEQYSSLLHPLGIEGLPDPSLSYLEVPPRHLSLLRSRLSFLEKSSLVAVVPGARWPSKLWQTEKFAQLLSALHAEKKGMEFLLLGSESEFFLCREIEKKISFPVHIFAGKTSLWELAALLKHCHLVISGDTGPMHLASLLKVPVVSILGPNRPEYIHPWGTPYEIASAKVFCLGCEKVKCPLPIHHCMVELDVQTVLEACRKVLKM